MGVLLGYVKKSAPHEDHLGEDFGVDNVKIYKDEDGWTMLVDGHCQHLQANGDCGIYEERPDICREHTNDYCEFDSPSEDGFELYFQDYYDLLKYCKKRFKSWDK